MHKGCFRVEEAQVDEHDFGTREPARKRAAPVVVEDKIQYLLGAEEQLLQAISSHAPLPEILNGICSALDCQIGNVVSLIALPGDDASDLVAIAMNAAQFGLHTFYSESVVAENGELLGALEMYGSEPRSPTADECPLIERARCLAALAIKLDRQAGQEDNRGEAEDRPSRCDVLEMPASLN
jgi:hypothetical protein